MKRIFLFLAAISLLVACSGEESNSEAETKQSSEANDVKPKAPERQGWKGSLYGDVESVTISEYDLKEKFGEVVKGDLEERVVGRFNEKGDVIEGAEYNSDGSLDEKIIYKYDSKGNEIERAEYNSDGSLDDKLIYKYDSKGNKIEQAFYNSDGSLNEKIIYKYDSKGNEIERARYNSDGSLDRKLIYKYDSKGNIIECTKYRGEIMTPEDLTEYKIVYRK